MNEERKLITQAMFNSFLNDIDSVPELLKENPGEKECVDFGISRLKELIKEPKALAVYTFMWTAYYCGAGFGLKVYETATAKNAG